MRAASEQSLKMECRWSDSASGREPDAATQLPSYRVRPPRAPHRQSQRPPRTSPTVPTLGDKRRHRRRVAFGTGRLSGVQRTRSGMRPGRTMPSRMSRDSRPSWSPSPRLVTGSSRATGRPRSTIKAGEPLFRPSMRPLRRFFASVMVGLFLETIIAQSIRLFTPFAVLRTG